MGENERFLTLKWLKLLVWMKSWIEMRLNLNQIIIGYLYKSRYLLHQLQTKSIKQCLIPYDRELEYELVYKANDNKKKEQKKGEKKEINYAIFIPYGVNISQFLHPKELEDISPLARSLPRLVDENDGRVQKTCLGKRFKNFETSGLVVPISWFWRRFSGFDPEFYYPSITSSQDVIDHIDKCLPGNFPLTIITLVSSYFLPSLFLGQDLTEIMSISDFRFLSYDEFNRQIMLSSSSSSFTFKDLHAELVYYIKLLDLPKDISDSLIPKSNAYFKELFELKDKISDAQKYANDSQRRLRNSNYVTQN